MNPLGNNKCYKVTAFKHQSGGSQMVIRRPKAAAVITWIVSVSLTLSPLMAQTSGADDPIRAAIGSRTDPVGAAILRAVPISAVPNVASRATATKPVPAAANAQAPPSPGQTKRNWLVGLMVAGGLGAAYALWPRGGNGGPQSQPGPGGTVILAGPPNVSTPNR